MENYLSQNLKFLRERHKGGISLEDVSASLGLKSRSTYSQWENGIREPRVHHLIKIAKFYRVTLSNLVSLDLTNHENIAPDHILTFEDHQNRCRLFENDIRELSDELDRIRKSKTFVAKDIQKEHEKLVNAIRIMSKSLKRYEDDVLPDKQRLIDMQFSKNERLERQLNNIPPIIRRIWTS